MCASSIPITRRSMSLFHHFLLWNRSNFIYLPSTSNPICTKPGRKPHFDAVQFTAHLSGQCALKVYQCPGEVCRLYTIFCSGTGQILCRTNICIGNKSVNLLSSPHAKKLLQNQHFSCLMMHLIAVLNIPYISRKTL